MVRRIPAKRRVQKGLAKAKDTAFNRKAKPEGKKPALIKTCRHLIRPSLGS